MSDVLVKINGAETSVPEGSTILEAAIKAGYDIPTLCNAEGLKPFTSCFVCAVKVEGGRGNLVPSCATKVRPGMSVTVESEEVDSARKMCITLLVSDHCGDCPSPVPERMSCLNRYKRISCGNRGQKTGEGGGNNKGQGADSRYSWKDLPEAVRRSVQKNKG